MAILNVLIAEDSENDALLLVHELRRGNYDVRFERVEDAEGMKTAFGKKDWDIVISDHAMPHFSAPEALEILRTQKIDIPFIIVSGVIGEEKAVSLMKSGANDYISKDNLARLIPSLERELKEAKIRREKKQVAETLREHEKRFKTFFEKAAISMVILEANLPPSGKGVLLEYNPAAQEFFGYSAEELRTKSIADLTYPDDLEKDVNLIMELLNNTRDSYTLEKRFIHKNGQVLWGKWSFTQIRDKNNNPKWGLATIEDITERKQSMEELTFHELRLQALLDLYKMGETSEQEITDFVVEKLVEITRSRCGLIGQVNSKDLMLTVLSFSHEVMKKCAIGSPIQIRTKRGGLWAECIRQKTPVIINDYSEKYAQESHCPIGHLPIKRFIAVPILEKDQVVGVAIVANAAIDYKETDIRPITSMLNDMWQLLLKKKAEKSLKLFRDLMDHSNDAVFIVEPISGNFLDANDKMYSLLGCTRYELLKMGIFDIDTKMFKPLDWHKQIAGIRKKGNLSFDVILKSKEKQNIPVEISVNYIKQDNQEYILGVARDISERKKMERRFRLMLGQTVKAKNEWETTFNNTTELIILVNKEHNIIRCNKSFAEFVGKPVSEILGKKCYEFVLCDQNILDQCQEHADSRRTSEISSLKTHRKSWFYINCHPVLDKNGGLLHSIIVCTDVTELKETTQRLLTSEQELKSRLGELEKFYEMAVGRELRMRELKKDIRTYKTKLSTYQKDQVQT